MSLLPKLQQRGGRLAINDGRRDLSYAALYRASWALATTMKTKYRMAKKQPIERPRVAYMTNRDILHPMAQFAAWHLDGVCIPLNSSSTSGELDFFVKNSQADIIICHADYLKRFASLQNELSIPIISLNDAEVDL